MHCRPRDNKKSMRSCRRGGEEQVKDPAQERRLPLDVIDFVRHFNGYFVADCATLLFLLQQRSIQRRRRPDLTLFFYFSISPLPCSSSCTLVQLFYSFGQSASPTELFCFTIICKSCSESLLCCTGQENLATIHF